MKKKICTLLLLGLCMPCISACGNKIKDAPVAPAMEDTSENTDTAEEDNATLSEEIDSESTSGNYSNVVYYVGNDIPVGGYVIHCTETNFQLEVTVFSNEENYEEFQNADKFTNGDYRTAVEQYAWADFYLNQDEDAYIGLQEGYIVLLDNGQCEFTEYDPATSQTIYSGIYVIGEDLNAEKINIKCSSSYMRVTQFKSKDNYLEYHKASRFTYGENSDAIEKHAESTDVIYTNDSTYANLQDGMILMVDEGVGNYSADEGPVIKKSDDTADSPEKTTSADNAKGDTSSEELVDGMRPEFKEAMDSYEAFYNDYCDILNQYSENPSDMQLLADYADMMEKAVEMTEKFEAWEEDDLNNAELAYYLDVNNRIMKKLLEVSE